jgi:hypothetical protein
MEPRTRADRLQEDERLTDERELAVAFLATASACAFIVHSQTGLALIAASLVALFAGYRRRSVESAAAAGILLYYPLAVATSPLIPGGWSFIASSIVLVILSERLSFEYRMARALKTPLGIDQESKVLASGLSRAHAKGLAWFVALSSGVALSAFAVSLFFAYFPLLAAASILLAIALWAYSRR